MVSITGITLRDQFPTLTILADVNLNQVKIPWLFCKKVQQNLVYQKYNVVYLLRLFVTMTQTESK